jgi:hypothetical protein
LIETHVKEKEELKQNLDDGISTLKVRERLATIAFDMIKKAHLVVVNMNKRPFASSNSKIAASPIAASYPIVNTSNPTQTITAAAMVVDSSVVENKIAEPIRQSPVPVV